MRNIIALVLVLAVAAVGFTACSRTGEPFEPQHDGAQIAIEHRHVVETNRVVHQSFLDMLERMQEHQPGAQSRVVQQQQSYRGYWHRIAYFAYPRFGSDLQAIDQYYQQRYRDNEAMAAVTWLSHLGEIADSPDQALQYALQVYAVTEFYDYVSVRFRQDTHRGGGEIYTRVFADVFDRHTGEKLSLGDAIDLEAQVAEIMSAVADYLRIRDMTPHAPFDALRGNQQFAITEQGIVLLFSPGELVSAIHGVIEILI